MAATRNAWNNENNRESGKAWLNERLPQFIERHDCIVSARVVTYTTNSGNWKLKLVVSCSDTRGDVNVELGSSFSVDWDRVDPKFIKNHDAVLAKEATKGAPRPSDQKRKSLKAENEQLKAQIAAMHAAMVKAGLIAA